MSRCVVEVGWLGARANIGVGPCALEEGDREENTFWEGKHIPGREEAG